MFSSNADFSNIVTEKQLTVSKDIQAAYFEINEDDTNANGKNLFVKTYV